MRAAALVLSLACASCLPKSSFELRGPVPPLEGDGAAFDGALFQTLGAHLVAGHRWELLDDGSIFGAIAEEIGRARGSVDVVVYIWHSGQPGERLLEALKRRAPGVACRVLVDPIGSGDFQKNVDGRLRELGCETHLFRPVPGHPILPRNHRKIVIVDGAVGFVGGFGIRHEWARGSGSSDPEWRDINVRLRGPVVNDLQRGFAQNWQEAGGMLLPLSDLQPVAAEGEARAAFVGSTLSFVTDAERLTQLTIASARRRLWIWNAYFAPGDILLGQLVRKRQEGVDVRLLLPGEKNDVKLAKLAQRRTYARLLAAGVRVFEYQPAMMHAKTMIVDERLAVIGSINLESLSLTRLEESAVVIDDPSLVAALERTFQTDVTRCAEIKIGKE